MLDDDTTEANAGSSTGTLYLGARVPAEIGWLVQVPRHGPGQRCQTAAAGGQPGTVKAHGSWPTCAPRTAHRAPHTTHHTPHTTHHTPHRCLRDIMCAESPPRGLLDVPHCCPVRRSRRWLYWAMTMTTVRVRVCWYAASDQLVPCVADWMWHWHARARGILSNVPPTRHVRAFVRANAVGAAAGADEKEAGDLPDGYLHVEVIPPRGTARHCPGLHRYPALTLSLRPPLSLLQRRWWLPPGSATATALCVRPPL